MSEYKYRVANLFAAMNTDHMGSITWADFQSLIDRQSASEPEAKAFETFLKDCWEDLRRADGNKDGRVSRDEMFADNEKRRVGRRPEDAGLGWLYSAGFDLMDTSHDGTVSKEEFTGYLEARNVTGPDALDEFTQLDLDGDGYLTRRDLAQAGHRFFTAPGSAPEEWLRALFTVPS